MKNTSEKLFKIIDNLLGIMIGLMVILTFTNVVLRFGFNKGIAASEELSRYIFVFMTFIGAISASKYNEHLGMDIIVRKFPKRGQIVCSIITNCIIVVMMGILVDGSRKMVIQSRGAKTAVMGAPFSFLYSICIVTGVAIILLSIVKIIDNFKKMKDPGSFTDYDEDFNEIVEEYTLENEEGGK